MKIATFFTTLTAMAWIAFAPSARSQDVVFLANGETRAGTIQSLDDQFFRVRVELAPSPGAFENTGVVTAQVSIPRKDVVSVEFSPASSPTALLAKIPPNDSRALQTLWKTWEPYLGIPKSPAGAIGNAYAAALLAGGQPADSQSLSRRIENDAWSQVDRTAARRNRLRAMIAGGAASAAQAEARDFARLTEDPALLIEAKHILAVAADESLRQLVKDNPRWQEDIHVIPERNRLYHEALDEYLHPYLFFGSEEAAAARGLWAAARLYEFCGDDSLAEECARDLVSLYPKTPESAEASAFLKSREPKPKNEAAPGKHSIQKNKS
ncbi:MAG: hypothetical protein Fur0032_02020 [Terrimicrobiaceae bacterium]